MIQPLFPTGRNTHAVNPYAVPSHAAYERAGRVVDTLLERHRAEHGRQPRTMALVLWGLDNIKTQGEGVAQARKLPVQGAAVEEPPRDPDPLVVQYQGGADGHARGNGDAALDFHSPSVIGGPSLRNSFTTGEPGP